MNCPACGAENPEGKEFCGDCGAHLAQDAVPAEPEGTPDPVPAGDDDGHSNIPESPYVQTTAIPHEQYAAGSVPQPPAQQAYQAASPPAPPQYQAAQPTYAQASPAAPPKKKTGLIIGLVAGVILLCVLGCCITLFFIPTDDETTTTGEDENTLVVEAEGERGKIEISEEQGFADSMDALSDVAEQYYRGEDWWYVEITLEDDYEEYYITPDEATYDKGVILEKRDDEWFVVDVYTVDMSQVAVEEGSGADTSAATSDLAPEDAAAMAVDGMLVAIMEGRLEDAYTFTTAPLYDYDLSVLTDSYTSWEFLGAEIQDDGSAVVLFTMHWSDGTTENVGALVLKEGDAWLVSDIGSADE